MFRRRRLGSAPARIALFDSVVGDAAAHKAVAQDIATVATRDPSPRPQIPLVKLHSEVHTS
ncbi:hypothetical protein [Streptomyces europaeiscabiei]|uniref:hypothetical protein n=1 Tax=Streptomyces europaeiscabiei TaxID=146819 RepID=UPI002E2A66E2|nr:hypothetical protein [Streptomyces europaeiscabiei]